MKKRNKVLLTGVTLLTVGGVTGYATTNIFGNLETIRDNYDITFNFAKSNKQKADELQVELNEESEAKQKLENEIIVLKESITELQSNFSKEQKDNKDTKEKLSKEEKEAAKLQEDIIKEQEKLAKEEAKLALKEAEAATKQARINELDKQITDMEGELARVEREVNDLLNYTNNGVEELTGEVTGE